MFHPICKSDDNPCIQFVNLSDLQIGHPICIKDYNERLMSRINFKMSRVHFKNVFKCIFDIFKSIFAKASASIKNSQ